MSTGSSSLALPAWIQERRNGKAPILQKLLAQMRQEPDNGIPHYEFAFHLLAIPMPIMEDGNSSFWSFLEPYLFYREFKEDVALALNHLDLALNRNIGDHLVAAKARYLLISLFMSEHGLHQGPIDFQKYPRLKTLVNVMIYESQKYSKINPASTEALDIQRAGYELLGNHFGIEEVEQAWEHAHELQLDNLRQANGHNNDTSTSLRKDGVQFENKVKRLVLLRLVGEEASVDPVRPRLVIGNAQRHDSRKRAG